MEKTKRDYPLDQILIPMGGTTVKDLGKMDEIWESTDYAADEKYDGSRYLSVGGRFFSRRVSVKDGLPVEKTTNVPHLNRILKNYPLLILDGEVYVEKGNSSDVVSIMGANPEKAIERQEERGYVSYVIYDILRDVDGNWLTDQPWIDRRGILEEQMELILEDNASASTHLSLSNYTITDKKGFYEKIVQRGGEGVMLKKIDGLYKPGKKPRWNWIKAKQEITADVVISGFKPPVEEYTGEELESWRYWQDLHSDEKLILDGKAKALEHIAENGGELRPITKYFYMGWIGAVEFSQYDGQGVLKQVGFCSGIKEDLREDMTNHPDKYIGECMEISAMERTKDGYFRHPQFKRMRPDKNPEECTVNED